MLYANMVFGQFVVIKPHVNTNIMLSGHLEFLPLANDDKVVWSLDYNGSLFRLRYKDRYLEPSVNGPKMIRGGKAMKELAKQETLAPLINALKIDSIFDESSFYSESDSDGSSMEFTDKNKKRSKKTNRKKNKKTNDTSSSISNTLSKIKRQRKKPKRFIGKWKELGRQNLIHSTQLIGEVLNSKHRHKSYVKSTNRFQLEG
ncbi:hypothetical protein EBI_26192 [Enterocytozoon bieneusi H348]|nr:hypothetical protein EBI_26192 [Enterocytozoon bieneusi H348]|eukprot:XP_002651910.1 hypothetical protein EBI_26192 [Enterocytozoon bieneusi H348]